MRFILYLTLNETFVPFNIAAFPDLIAREAMFAITSGRASKIISSTPMGHVILSSSRLLSSLVRRVILPTSNLVSMSIANDLHKESAHLDPQVPGHQ
jgi:hypothetical protein